LAIDALQVRRRPHWLEKRPEGYWLLRRRTPALSRRFPRVGRLLRRSRRDRSRPDRNPHARGSWDGKQKGQVRPDVLEQPGGELPCGGARLPLRFARCLVRGRRPRVPALRARLELLAG